MSLEVVQVLRVKLRERKRTAFVRISDSKQTSLGRGRRLLLEVPDLRVVFTSAKKMLRVRVRGDEVQR